MIFKYSYKLGASSDVQKAPGSPGPAPSGSIISHLPPEQPCGQRQAWYTRWRIVPFCTWHVTVLVTVCGHQFLQGKSTNTRPFRHKTNSADYFRRKVLVSSSSPCRILAPLSSYFPLPQPFVLKPLYGVYMLLISHTILPGVHCGLCLLCGHSSADKHPFAFSSRKWGQSPLGRG